MNKEMAKWCATGAVAFGGTLATTSDARAGLSWLDSFEDQQSRNFARLDQGLLLEALDAQALLAMNFVDGPHALNWSATTESGFMLDAAHPGNRYMFSSTRRVFTVDGTADLSATLAYAGHPKSFTLAKWTGTAWSNVVEDYSYADFAWSDTLTAGTYYVQMSWEANTSPFNGTVATFSVPAPGAIALLGVAGLAGRRRRG